jgi:tRNA1Val (adenine37-N6)-methyltransferase
MPHRFHFKNFSMTQAPSGQRINTDSCVFGHLAIQCVREPIVSLLDIGCGTGLLSLMAASQLPKSHILGVELSSASCELAKINFRESRFADRLSVFQGSIQDWHLKQSMDDKYDVILCNPPFFQNHLLGKDHLRNLARHNVSLSLTDLFLMAADRLADHGSFFMLISAGDLDAAKCCAQNGNLYLSQQIDLHHTSQRPAHAHVLAFKKLTEPQSKRDTNAIHSAFYYFDPENGKQTPEFLAYETMWLKKPH